MQKIIDLAAVKLIHIIESKKDSKKVALQFILEELDAAKDASSFIKDRIKSFYINESEYSGALNKSWDNVDGRDGPQQFLLLLTMALSERVGIEAAAIVRISIVEYILHHYKLGRYYANSDIKIASKPLKLFKVIAKESKLNPNFKFLLSEENIPIRDVISRWAGGFEDRDNKFNYEFQTTFNSSFWELYLFQCFKDLKLSADFSKASPDFTVKSERGEVVIIEAVTANHAENSDPEWFSKSRTNNVIDDKHFISFACVRILNSITEKHKKYIEKYSEFEHVKGKPFVVAVAPFEQPLFFMQNNEAIIRVLYGQGIDSSNGLQEASVPFVMKNELKLLDLGLFKNDKFKEISAVIFSSIATIGKAITQTELPRDIRVSRFHEEKGLIMDIKLNDEHFETHLDGLQIHHNPYAGIKLNPDIFNRHEITHYFYDPIKKKIYNQQNSYTIISRNIFSV
ncbi:hypothetical protein [Polaromonas glacialis]|uniref:hypothetical protein n=1 Tax=Polaromonas glacialis TaxID=866564 RepID=UPI000A6B7DE1|nr:hypothetical protein [Polaromonas glacialis]